MIKIRHTGLVTDNIDKSLFFWINILGFRIKSDIIESGKLLDKVLGYKNVKARVVKAQDKNKKGMLEILYFLNVPKQKKYNLKTYSYGFTHISLTVKNIDKLYKVLKKNKIKFNSKPNLSKDKKVLMTYCKTPEGAYLELVQERK